MHNMYGSYSDFLLAWECVDDDLIFFFGWTYPLIVVICEMQWTNISRHGLKKLCSILNQHYVYIRLLNRYSKSVFGNLFRTLKTQKRKVSSSLKSLNVNMLPVYRTTHLSSHIHSYYDWKRLFYSILKVQMGFKHHWGLHQKDTNQTTATALCFPREQN